LIAGLLLNATVTKNKKQKNKNKMNTLKLSVSTDQKAALLNGLVLGPRVEIAVTPADFPAEHWAVLVSALNLHTTPATVGHLNGAIVAVSDATPAALAAALAQVIAAKAEREATELADYTRLFAAWQADPVVAVKRPSQRINGVVYEWDEHEVRYFSEYSLPSILNRVEHDATKAAVIARITPEIDAHNAPHLAEIARLTAEQAIVSAAVKVESDRLKVIAKAERAAARLASGYYERDTDTYNERRYSSPWIAKVTFPSGAKPDYSFGDSTGRWGAAGLLRIECTPGEIIAWGQKDLRRPGNSEHTLLVMTASGEMRIVDKTEAFRLATA